RLQGPAPSCVVVVVTSLLWQSWSDWRQGERSMRSLVKCMVGMFAVATATIGLKARPAVAGPEDSVVRVYASLRLPNPVRPWAKQNPIEMTGTGVVLDKKTILTNAHIVIYAGEVFVQGREGGDRVGAKVASIGPEIDLATLTVEDETFLDK